MDTHHLSSLCQNAASVFASNAQRGIRTETAATLASTVRTYVRWEQGYVHKIQWPDKRNRYPNGPSQRKASRRKQLLLRINRHTSPNRSLAIYRNCMKKGACFKGRNCTHLHPLRTHAHVVTTDTSTTEVRNETSSIVFTNPFNEPDCQMRCDSVFPCP